jgi:rhamnulokinase
MIPDLCTFFLCGEKAVERTEATTTQMYSPRQKDWVRAQLNRVKAPVAILPPVIDPGTVLSPLRTNVIDEFGFSQPFPAIAVGSHDTASAIAAIPNMNENSVFLSSGTWSLMGVETTEPNTSEEAMRRGFTNEGGANGTFLLLKNITGLWIVQECIRHWTMDGQIPTWGDLLLAAQAATPLRSLIDPDAQEFQAQCDMPDAIRRYCVAAGQSAPQTVGQIMRCGFESLSLRYRSTLESLRNLTGRDLSTIRVVGGGGLNPVLCQMTADACNCEVVCGPTEASALGNVMLQAIATGHISDVRLGREAIAQSVERTLFHPHRGDCWDEAYGRFCALEAKGIAAPVC